MKKLTVTVLFAVFIFVLTACSDSDKYDEISTYIIQQETEETYTEFVEYPDISEISPETTDPTVPIELPFEFNAEEVRSYTQIRADKSYITDTDAEEVYRNNYDEYFVYSDEMAFVILTDSSNDAKRSYCYSAYYNEDGKLFFIGDEIYCWYYNDSGEVDIITYTYIFEEQQIGITFYDKAGKRLAYMANGIYYDSNLNMMTSEQTAEFKATLGSITDFYEE